MLLNFLMLKYIYICFLLKNSYSSRWHHLKKSWIFFFFSWVYHLNWSCPLGLDGLTTEEELKRLFDVSAFFLLCVYRLLDTVPCSLSYKKTNQPARCNFYTAWSSLAQHSNLTFWMQQFHCLPASCCLCAGIICVVLVVLMYQNLLSTASVTASSSVHHYTTGRIGRMIA